MLSFIVLSLRNNTGNRLQISMTHTVKNRKPQFLEAFPSETHTFLQTEEFGNSFLTVITRKLIEYHI